MNEMAPGMRQAITYSNTDPFQFDKLEPIEDFMLKAWHLAHPYWITIWKIFQISMINGIADLAHVNQSTIVEDGRH